MEPRNRRFSRVPTRSEHAEGNTAHPVIARDGPTWRGRRPLACTETLCAGPGRPCICPGPSQPGPHGESTQEHDRDARVQGVGQLHSTNETTEQRELSSTDAHGGGRGGKGAGQGEGG